MKDQNALLQENDLHSSFLAAASVPVSFHYLFRVVWVVFHDLAENWSLYFLLDLVKSSSGIGSVVEDLVRPIIINTWNRISRMILGIDYVTEEAKKWRPDAYHRFLMRFIFCLANSIRSGV
jgi:hypothetical protein